MGGEQRDAKREEGVLVGTELIRLLWDYFRNSFEIIVQVIPPSILASVCVWRGV